MLDDKKSIADRIFKINNFDYKQYPALAKTKIFEDGNSLVYKQELFKINKIKRFKKEDFLSVANALEYLETKKFIHGDLNKKNIIHTNNGFKIIDFEPSLHQIKNGMKQLMITIPYIIKSDLDNQKLTILTDKIGFIYFLLRVTKQMKSMDVVKLRKSLDHEIFLNIKFNEIKKKTYNQLLDIFFDRIEIL